MNSCIALLLQAPKVQASKEAKAAAATASSKGKKKVLLRADLTDAPAALLRDSGKCNCFAPGASVVPVDDCRNGQRAR